MKNTSNVLKNPVLAAPNGSKDHHSQVFGLSPDLIANARSAPYETLSMAERRQRARASDGPVQAERRERLRYPLDLNVRYRGPGATSDFWGSGAVVNLSSRGCLVISGHDFNVGTRLEMSIDWPALLEGRIPLQLFATGRVLRAGTTSFAASFERHEFRIRGNSIVQA